MIAGQLTAGELALLRTRPQRTELYLAIAKTHSIYVAQVHGTPASNDGIAVIPFYNGAGTLTNVKAGMLLCVGSFAGLWDIGLARIRKDAAGGDTSFYIGATSEIDFVGDYYLTVLDSYSLWPRHPYINPTTQIVYMDYDIAYTNQNVYGAPIPIMGSHAVLELTGATVTTHFDGVGSYSCIGVPVSYTYAWTCAGATVITPAGSSTDITFTAAGTYLVRLTVTADYGGGHTSTSTAVRYVIVYDALHPLIKSFFLESCSGSYDEGDWTYRVTMHAEAGEADIRDRALCILVAKDWYGDTQQSIGPLEGRENIVCVGWLDGESIQRSNDLSTVEFEVRGPAFWLGVQRGFPTGIDDTNVAPVDWSHIQALDPRKGLFAFLHWRSTTTMVLDCTITPDNHRLATTYTPADSLLEQLRAICDRINIKALCDRYARLFCEIDIQFYAPAFRLFPVVQTFANRDWREAIRIERKTVENAGQVSLSGVYYSGSIATSNALFALSPGHYPKHHGPDCKSVEKIALDDQAEANLLAGLWCGYLNNEYPHVDVPLSANHRAFDIAPRMFAQLSLAAGDTPRKIVWTNRKLIPREVSFNYDWREALLLTDVTFEAETYASDAVIGDPPIEPPEPPPPPPPPTVCSDPAAINFGMIGDCVYPPQADIAIVMNPTQLAYTLDIEADFPTWVNLKVGNLLGVNVGHFKNVGLHYPGAWVITHGADLDANGLWRCADITAAAPAWTLILSITAMRAATGGGNAMNALGVDDNGVCYIDSGSHFYFYGVGSMTLSGAFFTTCAQYQFAISSGADVRMSVGAGGVPRREIFSLSGGTPTSDWFDTNQKAPPCVQVPNFITDGGVLCSYPPAATIYTGASYGNPLVSDGANVLNVKASNGDLMNGAAALDTALHAFGMAGRTFGGYALGPAGFDEIIAVSNSVGANHFIILKPAGDTEWYLRDGDFVAKCGNWAGGGGAGECCSMILLQVV